MRISEIPVLHSLPVWVPSFTRWPYLGKKAHLRKGGGGVEAKPMRHETGK